MGRGRFITLEGGEGAGKSTQARLIVDYLTSKGIRSIATREVGGAPGAEEIRDLWLSKPQGYWDPLTEVVLIMAARREHLARTVLPALDAGVWVVSDRYVDSTRAYQGEGLGLGVSKIDALYKEIAGDFWPDATLLLDLAVEIGLDRISLRSGQTDRYERQTVQFHEQLRNAFLKLANKEPQRIHIVDAGAPLEDVQKAIISCVKNLIEAA